MYVYECNLIVYFHENYYFLYEKLLYVELFIVYLKNKIVVEFGKQCYIRELCIDVFHYGL